MASELLTHLGVACESCYLSPEALVNNVTYLTSVINPGGAKSAIGTPCSVSETISEETEALLKMAKGFGKRKQPALKTLVCHKIT